jgi:predicted GNAT superfamily acetyltransferase
MTELSDIGESDLDSILALNNAAVPHVNELNRDALQELVQKAFYAKRVVHDEAIVGFLIVLEPGEEYQSLNYQWFSVRLNKFAYVDRIVIAESQRGKGLGKTLYEDLTAIGVRREIPRICCEVNIKPPNPDSAAFHAGLGFQSVGTQATEGGSKQVDLLIKELA